MVKITRRYFHLIFLLICIIMGTIRKIQLDAFEKFRFGYVQNAGTLSLLGYISLGILLTAVSMILSQVYISRYNLQVKIRVSTVIIVITALVLFAVIFTIIK